MAARLLIVDDHEIVRSGVRSLLADTPIEVVASVGSSQDAISAVMQLAPDVVLLDVVLGNHDGFRLHDALRDLKPSLQIVFFSAFDNPRFVARAATLGAAGYVSKGSDRETLIGAIESAASGRPTRVRRPSHRGPANAEEVDVRIEVALTEREQQVLVKLSEGLTNKKIADALEISYETVKEHVQHILQKVGVTHRTQAAVWAVRRGLL